jgi:hypothetical protein
MDIAIKQFRPIVSTTKYLKQMLKQSENNPFPLKGIEHCFVKDNKKEYCTYCGYKEDNLNHICR